MRGQASGARGPFGVVLAAGHGRRMGEPKALLAIQGVTLLDRHLARLAELECRAIVVVVRPEVAVRLGSRGDGLSVELRVVAANSRSQAESLARGAVALDAACTPADDDAVLVTPVDLIPPRAATLHALLASLLPGIDAATPTFRGKGGHPVVVRFGTLRRWADASPRPLKELLDALGERRARLAVEDAAVLGDLDVPADLATLRDALDDG